jgi:hypothetical protein
VESNEQSDVLLNCFFAVLYLNMPSEVQTYNGSGFGRTSRVQGAPSSPFVDEFKFTVASEAELRCRFGEEEFLVVDNEGEVSPLDEAEKTWDREPDRERFGELLWRGGVGGREEREEEGEREEGEMDPGDLSLCPSHSYFRWREAIKPDNK